jgi:hypothetical protein
MSHAIEHMTEVATIDRYACSKIYRLDLQQLSEA